MRLTRVKLHCFCGSGITTVNLAAAQLGNASKPLDETFLAPPEDPAEPDYKASYRRQMDMYQWIARKKGFQVSNTGYFVYVDGQHRSEQGVLETLEAAES